MHSGRFIDKLGMGLLLLTPHFFIFLYFYLILSVATANTINLFGEVVTRGLSKTENDSICSSTMIALFTLDTAMLLSSAKHSFLLQ